MATILYARVSCSDQTLEHQITQAHDAGFAIDEVVADHGISGVSTNLKDRPEGRRLFDLLREGDTLVVRWVDRLGRSYGDVTTTIRQFMSRGVKIETVINRMVFDGSTSDPIQQAVRDAMIGFMAAMAEAQAEVTREAQRAGINKAKAEKKYRGRKPSFDRPALKLVQEMNAKGSGTTEVAKASGLSRQTVIRINSDPAGAVELLEKWNL
ncbi:MAG: recombinase family protein [Pseudomonadota bacterium]